MSRTKVIYWLLIAFVAFYLYKQGMFTKGSMRNDVASGNGVYTQGDADLMMFSSQ